MQSGRQLNAAESLPDRGGLTVRAIDFLQSRVRLAYRILGELEACMSSRFFGVEDFEVARTQALSRLLASMSSQLPAVLDLLGMAATRDLFLNSWSAFAEAPGATEADYTELDVHLVSRPLQLIADLVAVLGVTPGDPPEVSTLEYVLRSTPQILAARRIRPRKELDVQRALSDHLECTFPDFTRRVQLPMGLKSFEPDGAIRSIEALVEIKFVDSKKKLGPIFSGILEDMAGYGGTKDWTRFYSLIYQTEPFVNEVRFDRSLRLTGDAGRWKPIVVTGPGERSKQQG